MKFLFFHCFTFEYSVCVSQKDMCFSNSFYDLLLLRSRGPWQCQQPERLGTHILSSRLGNLLGFCQEVSLFIRYDFWSLLFFTLVFLSVLYEFSVVLQGCEIAIEMLGFVLTLYQCPREHRTICKLITLLDSFY